MDKKEEFDEGIKALVETFCATNDYKEMENLLVDLCSIKELQSLGQRLLVVKMLIAKKTYAQIESETGASSATISRVRKCLEYGAGGYQSLMEKLEV